MTRFEGEAGEAGWATMRRRAGGTMREMYRGMIGVAVVLVGLALGAGMRADFLGAQATAEGSQDPRYKKVTCENGGRTGTAEFTDEIGNVHQLWYENYGFRTGDPKNPGGWYEMGSSGGGSELPANHRINGAFDDGSHTLNGTDHPSHEDLDHAHAFNMMRGLLNICLNTEG